MLLNKDIDPIFTTAVWRDGDKGYGCAANINGLFEIDFVNKSCSFIHFFSDEDVRGNELYTSMIPYGESLILLPGSAEYLMIFDKEKKIFRKVNVRNTKLTPWQDYAKYGDAIVNDNMLLLLPERYSYIAKVDINTFNVEYIDLDNEELTWIPRNTIIEGGLLKLVSTDKKSLLVFNKRTGKVNIQSFNGNKTRINASKDSKQIVDYSKIRFEFKEGRDEYWNSVFASYEKQGAVTVNEETDWISFSDMVSYVEWKKKND